MDIASLGTPAVLHYQKYSTDAQLPNEYRELLDGKQLLMVSTKSVHMYA